MVLVTGGTGFIGSHLVELLCARGFEVRCLNRPRKRSFQLPAGIETVDGDLAADQGIDNAVRGAGIVIHLAGTTKALSRGDFYAGNVRATENLAKAIAKRPARLIHVSSLAAVGPGAEAAPATEDTEPHPVSDYGKSKLEAERIIRALVPDAVIVRPPVVYGPRDTGVFPILKSISRGFAIEIGGGERWFQAIYVKDLVEGLFAAAQNPRAAGRTYFLAHPKPVSWSELASVAACVMHRRPRTVRVPAPLAYAVGLVADAWSRLTGTPGIISREKIREAQCRYWTCDAGRAAEELDFEARTPLSSGIAETLAWYKEAGWLKY